MSQNPLSGVGTAVTPDVILLKRAVLAFRSGDKQTARDLLVEACEHNAENELVWLWRASAARTRTEAYEAVLRVLQLNPQNEKAQQWIQKLQPVDSAPTPTVEEKQPVQAPAASNGHSAAYAVEVVSVEVVETEPAKVETIVEEQPAAEIQEQEAVQAQEIVEEQAQEAAAAEESKVDDDAESRLAALEAALGQQPGDQASEPQAEAAQQVEGYGWGTHDDAEQETLISGREDADDVLARLMESATTSEQIELEDESDEDPLLALLASTGRADLEAQPIDTSDRDRAESEEDIWESLGIAGMDTQRALPAHAQPVSAGIGAFADSAESAGSGEETEELAACFICEKYAEPQDGVCSSCRAIVDLELLDLTPRHEGADRAQLIRALDRLREEIEDKPSAKAYIQAALTCLNLRQSQQALLYVREACRMRPHDRQLVGYYDRLEKRPLILAVDDSKTVQKMISTVLEKESYRIVQAEDGLSAIAKLDEEMPSLILLDITMPRMDGYQVCKVITGNDVTKHIPVIMLSGKDGFFDKVRGKMVGASNYITKPFDPADLTKTIAKFIKN